MGTKLHVGNLANNTTEAQLRELFGQAGTVQSVTLPLDRTTHTPRGFAFVEMSTSEEAARAVQLLNGRELNGSELRVGEARPRERAAREGFGSGFGRDGGHHGRDRFSRGDSRSGFGRGNSHRGRG